MVGKKSWRFHSCDTEDLITGTAAATWENTKTVVVVFKDGKFVLGRYQLYNSEAIKYIKTKDEPTYTQSTDTLTIGGAIFTKGAEPTCFWKGTMNDFRVYNKALSEDEVNALILSY